MKPEHKSELEDILANLSIAEQKIWIDEAVRLTNIVIRYQSIKRKRKHNKKTGKYDFIAEVYELCDEVKTTNPIIVSRERNRARPSSPHTLDKWARDLKKVGPRIFIRSAYKPPDINEDKRFVQISREAVEWVNENWRTFQSPRALYNKWEELAELNNWQIPSESWIYRRWKNKPEIVTVVHEEGQNAYESKLAPYVPRDHSDLEALQVVCGDHLERDVHVHIGGGNLIRPWLTIWLCLRTGLIWGWYLSTTPNSEAIGLAYADGIAKFGAQPFSRPEDGFHSYVYTDRGKSYRSHNVEGKVIEVHERAMDLTGNFLYFLVERSVGIIDEFKVNQLLANTRNPKEKPVERLGKDFSEWEKNTFKEYCGKNPSERPESWYKLYEKHKVLSKKQIKTSPFIEFDEYREQLNLYIQKFNSSVHEKTSLGGKKIIPIEEYEALYKTRYEIAPETVAMLLMKSTTRTIGKDGVNCFQKNWFYWNDEMSLFKKKKVEVRFSERDYTKVWVIMPDKTICEAKRIEPSSLLIPNQETLKQVRKMRANEKNYIDNFHLIHQSSLRGETIEDRLNKLIVIDQSEKLEKPAKQNTASIHLFSKFRKNNLKLVESEHNIVANDVSRIEEIDDFFEPDTTPNIVEFDLDD